MPNTDSLTSSLESCGKNITKTHGSVSCIFCLKWFHPNCVGINTDQLAALAKSKGALNYICDSCKDVRSNTDSYSFREELRKGLADIQTKFDVILSEVKQELNTKLTELKNDIDNCNKMIKFIDSSTTNKILFLEDQNEVLNKRLNRSDILINGLPKYHDNINELVVKIFKQLNADINPGDINNCYFINQGNTVLVKLNNIPKRDLVMRNYFKTRDLCLSSLIETDINKRIFLNDHVTPKVGRVLFLCRRLRKDNKILKYRLINSDKTKIKITLKDNTIKIFDLSEFFSYFNLCSNFSSELQANSNLTVHSQS
ncbi:hypothetical protein FF38_14547 [Lucilia cuprina]|uniref:Zinc finger PHD-type domain-containing protein n=1 Tax=Lucilia cuprina TaxID=7375 RepID=A0A0L0CLJ8_LUCCU|nr:hypothetical protein FF38_14547 [Lucilia cuprina]